MTARAVKVFIMTTQTAIIVAAEPAIRFLLTPVSVLVLLLGQTSHDQTVVIFCRHGHSIHGNRLVLNRLEVDLRLQVAHLQAVGDRVPMSRLYLLVLNDLMDIMSGVNVQAVCAE